MESYVHMLLAAKASRGELSRSGPVTDLDAKVSVVDSVPPVGSGDGDDGVVDRSQCASTCSSESAANSFDIRLYPHNPSNPPINGHAHQPLVSSNPLLEHGIASYPTPKRSIKCRSSPLERVDETSSKFIAIATAESSDQVAADNNDEDDRLHSNSVARSHLFRIDTNLIRSSLPGKFFQRWRGNGTAGGNSTPQYNYTPLSGSESGSLRRSNSHSAITSIHDAENMVDRSGGCSYWLSSDLLRQHTERLQQCTPPVAALSSPRHRPGRNRCDSAVQIEEMGDTLELCDANSAASGDRSFPTSLSDLDTFPEGKSSSTSSSSCTPSTSSSGQKMLSASDTELSSEVESVL